ncbi:IS5 family transposase [Leptothrix sp. C29]|uniref:IS5 family transposase n=1 Tax=Sphaerotilus uruguayifluvii TaxID=2735897 RepID=A0ABX2G7C7_9BURK|nr:IS5 family transposase [Leptothrix sp. C29]
MRGWRHLEMLRIRFERQAQTHVALLRLACCVICLRTLIRFC